MRRDFTEALAALFSWSRWASFATILESRGEIAFFVEFRLERERGVGRLPFVFFRKYRGEIGDGGLEKKLWSLSAGSNGGSDSREEPRTNCVGKRMKNVN